MQTLVPKQILIVPLDWGLGHTTRCVPLIRYIQSLGHVPIVGGNSSQLSFLRDTLGDVGHVHFPGYEISYSRSNRFLQSGLLLQLPAISRAIALEHLQVQQIAKERRIDGIISDNRYGLFHSQIPSAILTHQLQVQSGIGGLADRAVQRIHYKYLDRFSNVWVVDTQGTTNLAGALSHPRVLPHSTRYIGLLSRFAAVDHSNPVSIDLLVLLSGPEPQRSELSAMLWRQLLNYPGKVVFIEGTENAAAPAFVPPHISYHKRLAEGDLIPLLQTAAIVVCRSGYSTIMDLVALRKRAILIPTPGQTEQEYLGRYLCEQGLFYTVKQSDFRLEIALQNAAQFRFQLPQSGGAYEIYKNVIGEWIEKLGVSGRLTI